MRSPFFVRSAALVAGGIVALALAACGNDGSGSGGSGGSGTTSTSNTGSTSDSSSTTTSSTGTGTSTGDAQTPPQGEAAVKAWLAMGDYKNWHCETKEHDARAPSPHGVNRICSNDALAAASPPFPKGSAAVKELWDKAGGTVMGYAVYLKLDADSANGASWYWYEDNPSLGGVVADGTGDAGGAKTICVSCHSLAGSDSAHMGAGDFVYTQVK